MYCSIIKDECHSVARLFKRDYNLSLSRWWRDTIPIGAWRSPASALAWGARGRRFKSSRPDLWDQPHTKPPYRIDMAVFFNAQPGKLGHYLFLMPARGRLYEVTQQGENHVQLANTPQDHLPGGD